MRVRAVPETPGILTSISQSACVRSVRHQMACDFAGASSSLFSRPETELGRIETSIGKAIAVRPHVQMERHRVRRLVCFSILARRSVGGDDGIRSIRDG
jgi:hypothetical protein